MIASDKTGTLTKNEMTVRSVVTASGRVSLSGTGYAPEGEVHEERGRGIDDNQGVIDGPLRIELERALAVADRANNAVLTASHLWGRENTCHGRVITLFRALSIHLILAIVMLRPLGHELMGSQLQLWQARRKQMSSAVGIEVKTIPFTISVDEDTKVAEALSKVLADAFTLYLKTHNFHWNVVGPMFHTLHLMFEEQYNELWLAGDAIAERIRALGCTAPGSYREFSPRARRSTECYRDGC